MKTRFDGYYFKHQKGANTISFIVGISSDNAFIQIITNRKSYHVTYRLDEYHEGKYIQLGKCKFSQKGIKIDIENSDIQIKGKILYKNLTPLQYDIMGIFKYLPMECSHRIVSLHHDLAGSIVLNGETIDFTNGIGYIEGDKGKSFPQRYMWVQCNDFQQKCSIVAACANIPFMFFSFTGCICIVYYRRKEYRFATYLGVKITKGDRHSITLTQGRYRLEISVDAKDGKHLLAPNLGKMQRGIFESAACFGAFRFYENDELIFSQTSDNVSFENAGYWR